VKDLTTYHLFHFAFEKSTVIQLVDYFVHIFPLSEIPYKNLSSLLTYQYLGEVIGERVSISRSGQHIPCACFKDNKGSNFISFFALKKSLS